MITIPQAGVWGWPWHGLATGGSIPPSGKAITQPPNGNAWLIDMGLPAISLTAAETASAAANDYEWRNYALISGGRLYDTALPDNSYIHVDSANVCWLVTLSFSYPSANTVGISASIKRFGLFGHGEATPVIKTTTAACTHIELTEALGNPFGSYDSRLMTLMDVWTNGARALVGVVLQNTDANDLFSVIEVAFSGTGGTDGSGLTLAAAESFGQDDLTFISDTGSVPPPSGPFCGDLYWVASPAYQYYLPNSRLIAAQYARRAFYNNVGNPRFLALAMQHDQNITTCEDSWQVDSATETCYDWGTESSVPTVETHLVARITGIVGIKLIDTGDVVDDLLFTGTYYMHEWYTLCVGAFFSGLFTDNDWAPATLTVSGTLSGEFSAVGSIDAAVFTPLFTAWRNSDVDRCNAAVFIDPVWLGVQRIDAAAAVIYKTATSGGVRTFGFISTPLGSKTYSGPGISGGLNFAWQRKTGDFAFSTSPICYV